VRVQPIHFQGTVETAWECVLAIAADVNPVEAPSFLSISENPAPNYA
jgi:hypothetical protein